MFTFLKALFSGTGSDSPSTNTPDSATNKNTLTPELYSMDFRGAERITVVRIDQEEEGQPQFKKEITDSSAIDRIVTLLNELPKDGPKMKNMVPHTVHTIVAHKAGEPFAWVTFHRNMLKTESTGFLGHGDEAIEVKQAELFSLIKID